MILDTEKKRERERESESEKTPPYVYDGRLQGLEIYNLRQIINNIFICIYVYLAKYMVKEKYLIE